MDDARAPTPIGGFFELELPRRGFPHSDAILLNSGRSCIDYVLRANHVRHVYVPKYTCDVVVEPLVRNAISYSFYSIDEQLKIAEPMELADGEYLIANNYFGVKDEYCRHLSGRYGRRLILDYSQAWFAGPPSGSHCFYTPRKFVGVADGGCLYTDRVIALALETDSSHARSSHLLKRIDLGAEQAYADFRQNDASLTGEPMKWMSPLTRRLLEAIDWEDVVRRRRLNYAFFQERLGPSNLLDVSDDNACPMVFPFLTDDPDLRRKLIANKVFVAAYWPNVLEWCGPEEREHRLATRLIPLPIDQRYGIGDMERIVEVLQ